MIKFYNMAKINALNNNICITLEESADGCLDINFIGLRDKVRIATYDEYGNVHYRFLKSVENAMNFLEERDSEIYCSDSKKSCE